MAKTDTESKLTEALQCLEALEKIARYRGQCTAHSAQHRLLDELELECRARVETMAPEPPKG